MPINYVERIRSRFDEIDKLVSTPTTIRDICTDNLASIEGLPNLPALVLQKIGNTKDLLNNIQNTTLKREFVFIYNEACVLAVSTLAAMLEQYFVNYLNTKWQDIIMPREIKITIKELKESWELNPRANIGKIVFEKDSQINFQDLQATLRCFKEYFGKSIEILPDDEKKIIFYQQCRHVLLHADGKVSQSFLDRVMKRSANIKNYSLGEKIELSDSDWEDIKIVFITLVEQLIGAPRPS